MVEAERGGQEGLAMAANEIAVAYLEYARPRGPGFAFRPEIDRRNLRSWLLNCRQYVDADRAVDDALMTLVAAGDRRIALFADMHGTLDARIAAEADRTFEVLDAAIGAIRKAPPSPVASDLGLA
jgi:hypothetical protein